MLSLEEIQQYDADKIPVEPKDFKNDFEEIFELVKDRYPYTDEKHINFDSLHDTYLQRIDTMQSKVAYSLLIMEFFSNLKCAHADNYCIQFPWFIQGQNIAALRIVYLLITHRILQSRLDCRIKTRLFSRWCTNKKMGDAQCQVYLCLYRCLSLPTVGNGYTL